MHLYAYVKCGRSQSLSISIIAWRTLARYAEQYQFALTFTHQCQKSPLEEWKPVSLYNITMAELNFAMQRSDRVTIGCIYEYISKRKLPPTISHMCDMIWCLICLKGLSNFCLYDVQRKRNGLDEKEKDMNGQRLSVTCYFGRLQWDKVQSVNEWMNEWICTRTVRISVAYWHR